MDYFVNNECLVVTEEKTNAKRRKRILLSYYREIESKGVPELPEIPDLPE